MLQLIKPNAFPRSRVVFVNCLSGYALIPCKDVYMESTGKYWYPVFNILEDSCKVIIAHPKYVKAIRGKKTDKKDAKWIADLFKHDLVVSSFIPARCIRQLRDLCRYYSKLTNLTTSESQRTQNCLTVSIPSLVGFPVKL